MNVQEIIIGVIVACSLGFIFRRMMQIIKRIRKNEVSSCGCGCNNCPVFDKCSNEKKIAISSKNFLETLAESKNSRTFATAIEK